MVTHEIGTLIEIQNPRYPYNTVHLKVVESHDCKGCFFNIPSSISCSKPIIVGCCSESLRVDSKAVSFVLMKNKTDSFAAPKCTFCEDFKVLRYNFNKDVTTIIPVRGSTFHSYKNYQFKYCPVCGKELK